MYVNNDYFTEWMKKLDGRLREICKYFKALTGEREILGEGEKLLDNQDLSQILKVSGRTLQRYRSTGVLPFIKRGQKIHYKASDVRGFIHSNGNYWDKKRFEEETKEG